VFVIVQNRFCPALMELEDVASSAVVYDSTTLELFSTYGIASGESGPVCSLILEAGSGKQGR
jgi:hypothetical protein